RSHAPVGELGITGKRRLLVQHRKRANNDVVRIGGGEKLLPLCGRKTGDKLKRAVIAHPALAP
ncbi:MAG: hypothetical protein ACRD3E_04305, partial [Terriglobales bacterium]